MVWTAALMRRSLRAALALCVATFPHSPALAGANIELAVYEGDAQIVTGSGGTKITRNGIDYWTTGTPPRRYQVIGTVTDSRNEQADGGHAIGSPSIARKVRGAGGNAVIVQTVVETGNQGSTGLLGLLTTNNMKTTTTMAAIRYLPSE